MEREESVGLTPDSAEAYINRELSWLGFARRVLALAEDDGLPLFERIKFAGIIGMLHDEFFMKRVSGLKRQIARGVTRRGPDGLTPSAVFTACREEILRQTKVISRVLEREIRPALLANGMPILDWGHLDEAQRHYVRRYFQESVLPILTPLAVDAEHPFPFISNLTLNLAVSLPVSRGRRERFVRIKVPDNRPRWIPLPDGRGFVPQEQVIAANLDLVFPERPTLTCLFRVTRGAEGDVEPGGDLDLDDLDNEPGSIVRLVSHELKARRFAGCVRLQVDAAMPDEQRAWLAQQLGLGADDVYVPDYFLGLVDLTRFEVKGADHLRVAPHQPVTHRRLRALRDDDPVAIFDEVKRGDVLVHHPYHSFDTSVLRFLRSAAEDPHTLALKVTIYRTNRDSPIVRALAEAARRGKQVAVLVEITARFDEAPNMAWGEFLEKEGCHVSYGVERLKTHVKLALAVRDEDGVLKRYLHIGTGNYHTGTARIYEDLGLLTCDDDLCEDAASVFNALTGAIAHPRFRKLLVAPAEMRDRFVSLIRREAEHARAGRPSGIFAKMNQLQDEGMIRELYEASAAGVPITLVVRGLSCIRPGVPGLSPTIRLYSVVGRFLEHSRLYRFTNAGTPEYFIGSADWMKRNLDRRVETIAPIRDTGVHAELERIIAIYESDNASAWDCDASGSYERRHPQEGEPRREVQAMLIEAASRSL
ncbi:MAG: polyphosphate kinase 1 [Acidobacteria bacterium]|nr:polyphosphate kinase 1 [Acidobacteriota bacterium]